MSSKALGEKPLVLLGAGGHAKVLLSLIRASGLKLLGVCDPSLASAGETLWRGIPVLGGDEVLTGLNSDQIGLVNGVGPVVGRALRQRIYSQAKARGFSFPVLIHPTAWVDESVTLGEGVQLMAGVVVQPDAWLGENVVINTGASVDHDCRIEAHVHVAPGAVLCGSVLLSTGAYVGCGASVIQGVTVGEEAVVGAGTTVVRDVMARMVVTGSSVRIRPLADN